MLFILVYSLLVLCTIGGLVHLNKRLLRSKTSKALQRFYEHKSNLTQWQRTNQGKSVALSSEGSALAEIAVMYCEEVLKIVGEKEYPKFKHELEVLHRLL